MRACCVFFKLQYCCCLYWGWRWIARGYVDGGEEKQAVAALCSDVQYCLALTPSIHSVQCGHFLL